MTITETPPVKKTYHIELSEDELKIIGVLLGRTGNEELTQMIKEFSSYNGTPDNYNLVCRMFDSVCIALRYN